MKFFHQSRRTKTTLFFISGTFALFCASVGFSQPQLKNQNFWSQAPQKNIQLINYSKFILLQNDAPQYNLNLLSEVQEPATRLNDPEFNLDLKYPASNMHKQSKEPKNKIHYAH